MDSPIFGNHNKSKQTNNNNKNNNNQQYQTSDILSYDLYVSNKVNNYNVFNNSQVSNELKMTYTILMLQKNLGMFCYKIKKCINRKKYHAFKCIEQAQINKNKSSTYQLGRQAIRQQQNKQIKSIKQIKNPQTAIYTQICIKEAHKKLSSIFRVISFLKLKNLSQSWSRIQIQSEKNHHLLIGDSSINIGSLIQQTDLGISSKIESKKHLNSKKHAKQMKQNSLINKTISDYEAENEKLIQQITADQYNLQRFSARLNNLIAAHQIKLGSDTDRQTRLSQNVISQNSFQNNNKSNNINGTKSQLYTKKK